MIGALPESLIVGGVEYKIRTDYRDVLQVFEAFQDTDLTQEEKLAVAIYLLFEGFLCAEDVLRAAGHGFDLGEAVRQMSWFIHAGVPEEDVTEFPVYSWKQDEQMIFSAVNKVAGTETRALPYLHWWTFLGWFHEIGEGNFSFVVGIRNKINRGKKLDKHEKEFLARNKGLVKLEKPKTREEQEQEVQYKDLLEEVLG